MSMWLSEPCINTVQEEDAICRTPTSPDLKGLPYRKENTFQQKPDPGSLSFTVSFAWGCFLSQVIKATAPLPVRRGVPSPSS